MENPEQINAEANLLDALLNKPVDVGVSGSMCV